MFTGIIEGVVAVEAIRPNPSGKRLAIDLGGLADGVRPGDSIAIDGACLTVTEIADRKVHFDVVGETLGRTTLGELRPGSRVNVERSLKVGDRLGGHFVQGHVDAIGTIRSKEQAEQGWLLRFDVPAELARGMIAKGSIAVDGISLTLVEVEASGFSVAVIPHTLDHTSLGEKSPGRAVNIELDLIGKYIRKFLESEPGGRITESFLRDHGFA